MLFVHDLSKLGEEAVSDFLNMERFTIVNGNLVLVHVALWFDLKGIGVDLPGPEPIRTPKLNELRVCGGNVHQIVKQLFSRGAVLKT